MAEDKEAKPPDLSPGVPSAELGRPYYLPFSSLYDNRAEYPRVEDVPVSELKKMRQTDGQVRALMRLLMLPILASVRDMTVEPSEEGGEMEAEFIEKVFSLPESEGGMCHTFEFFVSQVLQALVEGFTAFELVYKVAGPDADPALRGKIVYHKLAYRDSSTISFLIDKDTGDAVALHQRINWLGEFVDVVIPMDRAFVYTANEAENPHYGVSYFLPAYYHWDKKNKLYYITHLAAQHRSVPGRVVLTKPGLPTTSRKAVLDALSDYGLCGAVAIPADWLEGEPQEFGTQMPSFNFVELINHHNAQSSKSVLAQFLDSQDNNTSLITTTSDDQDEMFVLQLVAIMEDVAALINEKLVPRLIDWNFGTGRNPTVVFRPITDEYRDAMREMFTQIAMATTPHVTPDFLFALEQSVSQAHGLGVDYEGLTAESVVQEIVQEVEVETPPADDRMSSDA